MDTKKAQMNICDYISYMRNQKGLASQTIAAYVSAVRKFYVMNDVQLNWDKIHSFKGEEEKCAEDRPKKKRHRAQYYRGTTILFGLLFLEFLYKSTYFEVR
jgi:site-specific recombinase XerD